MSQGQVLVMNVYVNLRRIPASLCRTVLGSLGYRDKNRNYSDWCAAALLGISRNMARANWRTLNQHGNRLPEDCRRPEEAEQCSGCIGAEALGVSANASQFALEVRVREAIHIAATGGTYADFVAAAQRIQSARVRMGTK
jgi:hypothetical protein